MRVQDAYRPRVEAYGSRGSAYDASLHGMPGFGSGLTGGLGLMPTIWGTDGWGVRAYPKGATPDRGVAGLGEGETFAEQAQALDQLESWGAALIVGTGHTLGSGILGFGIGAVAGGKGNRLKVGLKGAQVAAVVTSSLGLATTGALKAFKGSGGSWDGWRENTDAIVAGAAVTALTPTLAEGSAAPLVDEARRRAIVYAGRRLAFRASVVSFVESLAMLGIGVMAGGWKK